MQNNDNQKPTADDIAREFKEVRKSALWGKGPERSQSVERELVRLPLSQVDPDPGQPRRHFNKERLAELKASIEARGQLSPALVRRHPQDENRFMLIAGERRYRVLTDLGHESILAIVLPVSEQEAREIALIDNLQRADLSAFEEASGYQSLIDEYKYTQEEVAKIVGKDQTVISATLSINKLPEKIKDDEVAQQASKSVLLELVKVTDTKKQRALWIDIKKDIKAGISVSTRKTRQKRMELQGAQQAPTPTPPGSDKVVVVSKQLSRQLADLTPEMLASNPEQQEMLRTIRERLDELFAGLERVSPTPDVPSEAEAPAE